MVARDPGNPYQSSVHSRLRHVLLQNGVDNKARKAGLKSFQHLALRYGFRLDTITGPAKITSTLLEGVDVVVFNSGFNDGSDPLGGSSTVAMEKFIYQQGGSMLMVNGIAQGISCPGTGSWGGGDSLSHPNCLFMARALARQFYHATALEGNTFSLYVDSVRVGEIPPHKSGGAVDNIGPVPPASLRDHGISHAETRNIFNGLPRLWQNIGDRWYQFTTSPRIVENAPRTIPSLDSAVYVEGAVNVLVSMDEETDTTSPNTRMGDHPLAWTRKMGKGLSAYNNAGGYDLYARSDSVVEKFNGRLLRYLARDFVGCMSPGFAEYSPEASVITLTAIDDPNPCKTPVALRQNERLSGLASRAEISTRAGVIHVSMLEPGVRISVMDVAGKLKVMRIVSAAETVEIPGLKPGIYFVQMTTPTGVERAQRVNLF